MPDFAPNLAVHLSLGRGVHLIAKPIEVPHLSFIIGQRLPLHRLGLLQHALVIRLETLRPDALRPTHLMFQLLFSLLQLPTILDSLALDNR